MAKKLILLMRKGAPLGNDNASKDHAETSSGDEKRPSSLKDNIHIILHGTPEERKKLERSFFHLADTPQFIKDAGLKGNYFSVKYGVVSRHKNKDLDHRLSEEEWVDLCGKITYPFAIIERKENNFRMFVSIGKKQKTVAVGIEVKSPEKELEVNSIQTAFGYEREQASKGVLKYKGDKLTPKQAALLEGHNSPQYPPGGASIVSSESLKKSIGGIRLLTAYINLKAAMGKMRRYS